MRQPPPLPRLCAVYPDVQSRKRGARCRADSVQHSGWFRPAICRRNGQDNAASRCRPIIGHPQSRVCRLNLLGEVDWNDQLQLVDYSSAHTTRILDRVWTKTLEQSKNLKLIYSRGSTINPRLPQGLLAYAIPVCLQKADTLFISFPFYRNNRFNPRPVTSSIYGVPVLPKDSD